MSIKPLALVGMMGAGKSAVAQCMAELTGFRLVDLDLLVEERLGQSIAVVFKNRGEPAFRQVEGDMLAEVTRTIAPPYILACGGGTPLVPTSRALLRTGYAVVWLDAQAALLYERAFDPRRPLASMGRDAFLGLAAEREPIYQQVSHLRVDTTDIAPQSAAKGIVEWWKEHSDE